MNIPILILTLHHVSPQKDSITIHPELVKKALQSVKDQGYKFISYAKFKDMAFGRIKREPKSVLLTFDDGYFDFYRYAYPILTELQTPAVVFLITDKINDFKRKNFNLEPKPHSELDYKENIEYFLNLDEIRELYKSGLVEFDSHTATHFSCKSDDEIRLKDEFDRFTQQEATFIFVTNEIGSGGVSDHLLQRKFTDLEGWMNQYVAQHADEVILMVAGIPVKIK